ncbi:phage tail assembly chaperone GT [Salinicoccus sp. YB14-2]
MKEGEDINKVLKMPISYMLSILEEENEATVERKESMLEAFM